MLTDEIVYFFLDELEKTGGASRMFRIGKSIEKAGPFMAAAPKELADAGRRAAAKFGRRVESAGGAQAYATKSKVPFPTSEGAARSWAHSVARGGQYPGK